MKSVKHQSKKEIIIEHTITLLKQIGYEETSVRSICDAAGISIGTFYHYFKDKTELLEMILGKIDSYLLTEIAPTLNKPSCLENLKQFAIGFAKETALSSALYGGVISSPNIPLPHSQDRISQEHSRILYSLPLEIVRKGQQTGEFTTQFDAQMIVDKLITCLRGCSMDWYRRNYCYDIENYVSQFMDIYCRGLINQEKEDSR